MHLAILVTNTDVSDFAQTRPDDGQKFTALIQTARPDWSTQVFWVRDGDFPENLTPFDGVIITGSPASIHDDLPWIAPLAALIRDLAAAEIPLFGACFGHQLIAKTLGGAVRRNERGWGHGRIRLRRMAELPFFPGLPDEFSLYGSHIEEVSKAPPSAIIYASSDSCDIAGFTLGSHIFTTQHHPEMSDTFIADLVGELADYVGPEATKTARESLKDTADQVQFAEAIARFFEAAGK